MIGLLLMCPTQAETSECVNAIYAPRIVVEKRGLLSTRKVADDGLEAIEDRVVARP